MANQFTRIFCSAFAVVILLWLTLRPWSVDWYRFDLKSNTGSSVLFANETWLWSEFATGWQSLDFTGTDDRIQIACSKRMPRRSATNKTFAVQWERSLSWSLQDSLNSEGELVGPFDGKAVIPPLYVGVNARVSWNLTRIPSTSTDPPSALRLVHNVGEFEELLSSSRLSALRNAVVDLQWNTAGSRPLSLDGFSNEGKLADYLTRSTLHSEVQMYSATNGDSRGGSNGPVKYYAWVRVDYDYPDYEINESDNLCRGKKMIQRSDVVSEADNFWSRDDDALFLLFKAPMSTDVSTYTVEIHREFPWWMDLLHFFYRGIRLILLIFLGFLINPWDWIFFCASPGRRLRTVQHVNPQNLNGVVVMPAVDSTLDAKKSSLEKQ